MDTAYAKSRRKDRGYDYFEYNSYHGQADRGYVVGVSFLNSNTPVIFACHKEMNPVPGVTTTWSQLEKGVPISKEEYKQAFDRATSMSWFRVL